METSAGTGADRASAAWPGQIDKFRGRARVLRWVFYAVCGVYGILGAVAFTLMVPRAGVAPASAVLLIFGLGLALMWAMANGFVAFADASTGGLWALCSTGSLPGPALEVPLDETGARLKRIASVFGVLSSWGAVFCLGFALLFFFLDPRAAASKAATANASTVAQGAAALAFLLGAVLYFFMGRLLKSGGALVADGPRAVYAYRAGQPVDHPLHVRRARQTRLAGGVLSTLMFVMAAFQVLMVLVTAVAPTMDGRRGAALGMIPAVLTGLAGVVVSVASAMMLRAGTRMVADATMLALGDGGAAGERLDGLDPARLRVAADRFRSACAVMTVCCTAMLVVIGLVTLLVVVAALSTFGDGPGPAGALYAGVLFQLPFFVLWAAVLWAFRGYVKYGGPALSEGYALMPTMHLPPEGSAP